MTTVNTVKVGIMPGRLEEYAVPSATTISEVLTTAGISADGYEVKVDGNTITNLDTAIGSANVVLLSKKIKGNASIKIGIMPGRLEEYALEDGTTVAQALSIAGLSADGYEVKQDGNTVSNFDSPANGAVILLTKRVKGNATEVKMGIMPGRLDSYVFEQGTTFNQAFETAGINPEGYEIKADGNVITNFDSAVGQPSVILLTKKVKGN